MALKESELYRDLARTVLRVKELGDYGLPLPDMFADPPRFNIGDLTDEDDQHLCLEVCERTPMTPSMWDGLNEAQRIPWMRKAAKHIDDAPPVDVKPSSVEITDADTPPSELLAKLSKQQRKIVEFLWHGGAVKERDLRLHYSSKPIEIRSLARAIQRLNPSLRKYRPIRIEVEHAPPFVRLIREKNAGQ